MADSGSVSIAWFSIADVPRGTLLRGLCHGGVDRARPPGRRLRNKAVEECAGSWTDVVTPFRMPLNSQDKVSVRIVRVLSALDRLDHGVLRAASGDAKTVSWNPD